MDFYSTNFSEIDRLFNQNPRLSLVGYMAAKKNWVNTHFRTLNFSFILNGSGEYIYQEQTFNVQSPCVLLQLPNVHYRYGPSNESKTWEELFLIFPQESLLFFQESKLVDYSHPIWPIENIHQTLLALDDLRKATLSFAKHGESDRIDSLAQKAILESRLPSDIVGSPALHSVVIEKIRKSIEKHFRDSISLPELASDHGLSYTTFLRAWNQKMQLTPLQYIIELRMQEARKLLITTREPIKHIADKCGFDDPLYFSRKFTQQNMTTPRDFRQKYNPDSKF